MRRHHFLLIGLFAYLLLLAVYLWQSCTPRQTVSTLGKAEKGVSVQSPVPDQKVRPGMTIAEVDKVLGMPECILGGLHSHHRCYRNPSVTVNFDINGVVTSVENHP